MIFKKVSSLVFKKVLKLIFYILFSRTLIDQLSTLIIEKLIIWFKKLIRKKYSVLNNKHSGTKKFLSITLPCINDETYRDIIINRAIYELCLKLILLKCAMSKGSIKVPSFYVKTRGREPASIRKVINKANGLLERTEHDVVYSMREENEEEATRLTLQ